MARSRGRLVITCALLACFVVALPNPACGHVTLNDPNGGEVVEVGTTFTIEWQIVVAHELENWDLWYSNSGEGGPWIEIAIDLLPGLRAEGSINTYEWTVPNDPTGQARIRVRMDNSGTDYEDISNSDFAIETGGPIPTVSEWGLIVMALLMLAGGTIACMRRRPSPFATDSLA